MIEHKKTVYIIAGPTASGKSAYAMDLASRVDGEIINCDSLQIYDGLPILTAQPSAAEKASVPHHLYAALHPNNSCSAGNWREMVIPLIHDIHSGHKIPIIVGGTGLYIKALTDGLSPMPDVPSEVRARAKALQEELGNPGFYNMLLERDPEFIVKFHPSHTARLVRAWEVLEATGKSLSYWQSLERTKPPSEWAFQVEIIIPERSILRERCDKRFLWMIDNGAVEEAQTFEKQINAGDFRQTVPLTKALGYREILDWCAGLINREDAIEKAQIRTKQYAKQQVTWFNNQMKALMPN